MNRAIVLVHGAFCGGWAFDGFKQPFIAAGYETHAPNLPAHDRSADLEHLASMGVRDFSEAFVRYLHTFDTPPIVIGHSLGGLIAQIAATRASVSGLVLLCPSAPWGVMPTTLDEHGANFGLTMMGDYWRRPIAPDYRVARNATLDRLDRELARRIFARFVPESGRALLETVQWWLDPSMATAAPVYRINAPILAVAGGADRVNPASTVRRLINRFPPSQAAYHEFSKMSHWPMDEAEAPDVAAVVLDWLRKNELTPEVGEERPARKPLRLFGWGEAPQ